RPLDDGGLGIPVAFRRRPLKHRGRLPLLPKRHSVGRRGRAVDRSRWRRGGRWLFGDCTSRVGLHVTLDVHGLLAEAAEGDVVPGLEAFGLLVEVEDGGLDGGGFLVFEGAQAGAAGGALDHDAGAGGQHGGGADVGVSGEDERGGAGEAAGGHVVVDGDEVGLLDVGAVVAAELFHACRVDGVGGLVGGEAGVADAVDVEAFDVAHLVVEDDGVLLFGDGALGGLGVVVAAYEHVGDAEGADLLDELVLRLGAVVGDVAGVDDQVDGELVLEGSDDVPGDRVDVDVGDVQDADGAFVGVVERQSGDRFVQL